MARSSPKSYTLSMSCGTSPHTPVTAMTVTPDSFVTGGTGSAISDARRSLISVGILDNDEFKGDGENPSYAFDADIEGVVVSVDRSDEKLSNLELGRKYMNVFGSVHTIILDMSGTIFEDLYKPLKPFPGVLVAYKLLKQHGTRVIFVTNSWRTGKQALVEMMNELGFPVVSEDIFTSSDACKMYLKSNSLTKPYFLVDANVLTDFAEDYQMRRNQDCVVLGMPSTLFDYRLLSKGMELLIEGVPLVVLNMSTKEDSPNVKNRTIGLGPFVDILSCATDAEPIEVCKPNEMFYKSLCETYDIEDLSNVVLIGDDINEDIAGGKILGMKAMLIRTGKYKVNDEYSFCDELRPDATAETFVFAIKTLIAANAASQMTEYDFLEEEKSNRGCDVDKSLPKVVVLNRKMEQMVEASENNRGKDDKASKLLQPPSYIW